MHRKADMMERYAEKSADKSPDFAERMFQIGRLCGMLSKLFGKNTIPVAGISIKLLVTVS
jgi:hypothetical protein